MKNLIPNTTAFGEYPPIKHKSDRGQSFQSIKAMSQMPIGGSPTIGSDAFGEYSLIMNEPLSALCFLAMIQNLNLTICLLIF